MRDRFGLVLGIAVGAWMVAGAEPRLITFVLIEAYCVALFLAIHSQGTPTLARRGLSAVVAMAMLAAPLVLLSGTDRARGWGSLGLAVVQVLVVVSVMARLLQHTTVSRETVFGVLAVYVVFGLTFASVYQAIDLLGRGEAFAQGPVGSPADYSYFSFVTLTTLGYGDLTAATTLMQKLATFEAVVGQVFIAVVLARVVAMLGSRNALARRALDDVAPDSHAYDPAPGASLDGTEPGGPASGGTAPDRDSTGPHTDGP